MTEEEYIECENRVKLFKFKKNKIQELEDIKFKLQMSLLSTKVLKIQDVVVGVDSNVIHNIENILLEYLNEECIKIEKEMEEL